MKIYNGGAMNSIQSLEAQRDAILEQMRQIRSMKRGSITEQFQKSQKKGQVESVCGPYYVLSRRENGKTVSRRVKQGAELEQVRQDVERHGQFVELCRQFERLTEQLGELERGTAEEKKRRRSFSSKIEKSRFS